MSVFPVAGDANLLGEFVRSLREKSPALTICDVVKRESGGHVRQLSLIQQILEDAPHLDEGVLAVRCLTSSVQPGTVVEVVGHDDDDDDADDDGTENKIKRKEGEKERKTAPGKKT